MLKWAASATPATPLVVLGSNAAVDPSAHNCLCHLHGWQCGLWCCIVLQAGQAAPPRVRCPRASVADEAGARKGCQQTGSYTEANKRGVRPARREQGPSQPCPGAMRAIGSSPVHAPPRGRAACGSQRGARQRGARGRRAAGGRARTSLNTQACHSTAPEAAGAPARPGPAARWTPQPAKVTIRHLRRRSRTVAAALGARGCLHAARRRKVQAGAWV